MTTAGDLLLYAAMSASFAFVACYHLLAPWWRSETGRNVMTLMSLIALILLLNLSGIERWVAPARPTIRVVVYGLLSVVILWRLTILIRAQWAGRRK